MLFPEDRGRRVITSKTQLDLCSEFFLVQAFLLKRFGYAYAGGIICLICLSNFYVQILVLSMC